MEENMPGIFTFDDNLGNPVITSPNSCYQIQFRQTKDTLCDVETYKKFVDSAIRRFRRSRTYKHYKGILMNAGMDRCQFNGNLTSDMVSIEMHHNMLTIFDIAVIITEHILNTYGSITTFDLAMLLKQEHKNNRVQLVMLSLTSHQLYHNEPDFYIHPDMCFGKWWEFLEIYRYGITRDIANKIIYYLNDAIEKGGSTDTNLLELRKTVYDWSIYNEQNFNM